MLEALAPTLAARPTLLLVDDEPANLRILVQALQTDHELRIATSGEAALAAVALEKPDLVLLDVVMPDLDGYGVCRQLKADPRSAGIPVIFLSQRDEEVDQLRGLKLGAVDYITKPFSLPLLLARIAIQLQLKQSQDRLARQGDCCPLTGLPNRQALQRALAEAWQRGLRSRRPLAMVNLALDKHEAYYRHYGQQAGDTLLCIVAELWQDRLQRAADRLARTGAAEFTLLLPECDLADAEQTLLALQAALRDCALPHAFSEHGRITASAAISRAQPAPGVTLPRLIEQAEAARRQRASAPPAR